MNQCGIAAHCQDRRRAFDLAQQRRVIGRIVEQVARIGAADGSNLVLDAGDIGSAIGPRAAPGEIGQCIERGYCGFKAAQELRVGNRSNVRRAQQANAREHLFPVGLVLHRCSHLACPTRGSSPLARREMLARWSTTTVNAIAASALI